MGGSISLVSNDTAGSQTGSTFTMKIPLKYTRSRAPSTSSSEVHGSRPGSVSNNVEGNRLSTAKIAGDASPKGGFEKDAQPRLVGLSQPFFAAAPSSPATKDPKEQLAVLETASTGKEPGSKLRVLVAEDNLVNQEVVLR
jgi:osomolarity two-component system sensor histidine kinase SLN1